ncbi:MAG: M6 family metalloprotease domain-containing protein [Cyclobacteriaceae bacterium]
MRLFVCLSLLLVWASSSLMAQWHATSPSPHPVAVTQPGGQTLHILARGNDHHHWSETTDGYTIIQNKAGYYEYAVLEEGKLKATGHLAKDPADRDLQEMRGLMKVSRHLSLSDLGGIDHGHAHSSPGPFARSSTIAHPAAVPSKGEVRLLAILIDYPDLPHKYDPAHFHKLFNEGIDGKPSFRDYFLQNSFGQLSVTVDVVGWVRAAQNYSYYGDGNGKSRSRLLVSEAVDAAEAAGMDFSQYDNDGDEDVDGIIIVHAGPGAEEGGNKDYIWSHRWNITNQFKDGKYISDYTIQPETRINSFYGGDVGIGIFCHEFGHLLNLPDLYDMDATNGRSNGIGNWGLMGTGNWLGAEDYPAGLSAWSKEALGWIKPKVINDAHGYYSLRSAAFFPDALRLETGREGEYFLLENRQREGTDSHIPGVGMAIWHINTDKTSLYPFSNRVNGDVNLKGVDLEEADGRNDLDNESNRGDATDLYPAKGLATAFSVFSSPSSSRYFELDGSLETGISLENIAQSEDGRISFLYNRRFTDSGLSPEKPLIAFEGNNRSTEKDVWFEFTLPEAGKVTLTSRLTSNLRVFLSDTTKAAIVQKEFSPDDSLLSLAFFDQGSRLLLHWQYTSTTHDFEIRLENQVAEADSLALVAMYEQMDGTNWKRKQHWLSKAVVGWQGIKVANGRVVELDLADNQLKGQLPAAIGDLAALQLLRLGQNEINGTIPASIGQLKKLQWLELQNNKLEGAIPESFYGAVSLEVLNLSFNRLTGNLSEEIGKLSKLRELQAANNLLSQALPEALFALGELRYLDLKDNLLTGLPANFFSTPLTRIDLSRNQLQGELPMLVTRQQQAPMLLDLSRNQLTGSIPGALSAISFSQLNLSRNQLAGALPALQVSELLDVSDNKLNALSAPVSAADAFSLRLAQNHFTFEDLLPVASMLACSGCEDRYSPQAAVLLNEERIIRETDSLSYLLPFDSAVNGATYTWWKEETAAGAEKKLSISSFESSLSGTYRCEISHPELPGLVLQAEGLKLSLKPKEEQLITVEEPGPVSYGKAAFSLNAESSSGLPLQVQLLSGPVSLDGELLTITGVGEVVLKYSQAGNPDYLPAEKEVRFSIAKAEQQISMPAVGEYTYGDAPLVLMAEASSGLLPAYEITSGPGQLSGDSLVLLGAGTIRLKVSQAGNELYLPATELLTEVKVNKAPQQLSFASLGAEHQADTLLILSASSSAGLPVAFRIVEGTAELQNDSLRVSRPGMLVIEAYQSGNDNYLPAEPARQQIRVKAREMLVQQISGSEITDKTFGDAPLMLDFAASSGLPVVMEVSGPVKLEDQLLYLQGAGLVTVKVYQPGNDSYAASDTLMVSFEVKPARQQISFEISQLSDTSYLLDAEASSGLPVSLQLMGGEGIISDDTLFVSAGGIFEVQASQQGNENYLPAQPVSQILEVPVITSLEETVNFALKIYPNPVVNFLQIHLPAGGKPLIGMLYDARGMLLHQWHFAEAKASLDFSSYPKGVYHLQLSREGHTAHYRLLKQ